MSLPDDNFSKHPRLKHFLKAMQRCRGFGLYFVRCNTPSLRDELLISIKAALDKPIVELNLDPENDIYIDAQIAQLMESAADDAIIFIYNLESLFYLKERYLMNELNWRRNIYGRIEHPIVFWLPEFLVADIFKDAPDFADWYSGVYEFDLPLSERDTLALQTWDSAKENFVGELSLEEKQRWIINLKNLLAELEADDSKTRRNLLNRLGLLYDSLNLYDKALECYQENLKLCQELKDKENEGTTLNNISQIYDAKGDYETALRYLKDSLKIRQAIGNKSGECVCLFNLAHIYQQNGNNQQALNTWQKTYKIAKKIGNAQALEALENLAKELGRDGLGFWES